MIKRWNEYHVILPGEFKSMGLTFVECISGQDDLDIFTTKHFYLIDLLLGCNSRHIDHSFNMEILAGESYALGMIASTCTNNATVPLFFRKALNQVIGTA